MNETALPVQWGVEDFHSENALEAGVQDYLVGELENRHLGTAQHDDGREFTFEITVRVKRPFGVVRDGKVCCPVCGESEEIQFIESITSYRSLHRNGPEGEGESLKGEVVFDGHYDVWDEGADNQRLLCQGECRAGTEFESPQGLYIDFL